MSTPANPTVQMNDALSKAIQDSMGPEEIKNAIHAEESRQAAAAVAAAPVVDPAKAAADKAIADKAAADAAAAAQPQKFTRDEVINGKTFTFEADSDAELNVMVLNAYRVGNALQAEAAAAPVVDPAVAAAAEAKAAEAAQVKKSELELKFKRGEISTEDYLEQSGAVALYLEKQGVPLAELKATLDKNRTQNEVQSWQDATTEFLKTSDWPGGDQNLKLIGMKLVALNLTEATDKVAAISQAYAALKADKMLFPPDVPVVVPPVVAPAVAAPVVPPVAAPVAAPVVPPVAAPVLTAPSSSSIFGASSGVASTTNGAEKVTAAQVAVDPKATPEELIAQWKQGMVAAGQDPNKSFLDTFSARRA